MPYIPESVRPDLQPQLEREPNSSGELNYMITGFCNLYLETKGTNYTVLNEIIGVLECAKLEFYRRVVTPYEEKKRKENGDVY